MRLSDIKNINFWTREYKLPLFWLTDNDRALVEDDSLCFYKNNMLHLYLLNDRYEKEIQSGYRYFSKKGNFGRYKKLCGEIIEKLEKSALQYQDINIKELNAKDLEKLFNQYIKILNDYGEIYKITKETKLKKFENVKDKRIKQKLDEAGRMRFKMREAGEPIFYILLGKILKEIGKRFGVSVNDLYFYNSKELKSLFRGKKLSKRILSNRKEGYVIWIMNGKTEILIGERFKKMWKWTNSIFITKKKSAIKGVIANKGKIKGKVRLIIHRTKNISKQIVKFKKGEILVTEMTRPGTIIACRKATAIITDEGGITSHAAIISREFNIPCIVGAKIATQILKDGDLVEVDADKGTIRILEKI